MLWKIRVKTYQSPCRRKHPNLISAERFWLRKFFLHLTRTAPLDAVPEEPLGEGVPHPSRPSPHERGSSTSWLPNQRNSGWFNTVPQSPGRPSLDVAEGEFASSPRGPRDYPPENSHTHDRRKSVNGCIICWPRSLLVSDFGIRQHLRTFTR